MSQLSRRQFAATALAAGVAVSLSARANDAVEPWRKLATEPYRGKQDDIAFVSPEIGWYGNGAGQLWATTDGGTTWAKRWERPGTFVRALGFIDGERGFLGNVGTNYYPGVTDTHPLYATGDGGRSWVPVDAPGIGRVAGICGIDILPVPRVFQGERRIAHVIHAAGRVGGPAFLLRSEDDGATWRVIDLTAQASMLLDVHFLTPRLGFVAASSPSSDAMGSALILRTVDGGESWSTVYKSARPLENAWKMSWPTARTGYATIQSYDDRPANTRRVVIKTRDGGRSWSELALAERAGEQLFGVGFVDERRGWVGGKAGGYATHDGGRSWTPAAIGRAVNKVRIVRGVDTTRVFAIGVEVHRLDL